MLVVSRDIHIRSPVERVFALMADPGTRALLSPHGRPIRVEIEGGGPLRAGSVCHFRLQANSHIIDYRTRVREFVPNRRIVSVAETAVPFEVFVETQARVDGTLLSQTERFEPTEEMLCQALPPGRLGAVLEKIYFLLPFLDPDYATRLRQAREEMLARKLGGNLEQWLAAIRRHLENRN